MSTQIAKYFGVAATDIGAIATAEASPANAMTCVKPFTIPDPWIESRRRRGTRMTASTSPTRRASRFANPDVYIGPENKASYTGYDAERDKGLNPVEGGQRQQEIAPSFYQAWSISGFKGASDYRWNIANCSIDVMGFGDTFIAEPGMMTGPTKQGMDDLIAPIPTLIGTA